MKIADVRVFKFDLRLPETFVASSGIYKRSLNVLVIVDTDEEIKGYGECMPEASGNKQVESLRFLRKVKLTLIGQDPCDIKEIHKLVSREEEKTNQTNRASRAALDFACYDILGKASGKPLYQILGFNKPRIVPTTMTIGLKTPEEMAETAKSYMKRFEANGLERIKIKLRGEPKVDKERVLLVAGAFPGKLTLDVNGGFRDPEVAVRFFNELYKELGDKILFVEEPCPRGELDEMKYVTVHSNIPIIADQSAATVADVRKIIKKNAADGVNIKLDRAGGIYQGLEIADLAEKAGIDVIVTGTFSCGIHHAAAANFAAGTENVVGADIDTDIVYDLSRHVLQEGATFKNGARIPSNRPGIGIVLKNWIEAVLQEKIFIERFC